MRLAAPILGADRPEATRLRELMVRAAHSRRSCRRHRLRQRPNTPLSLWPICSPTPSVAKASRLGQRRARRWTRPLEPRVGGICVVDLPRRSDHSDQARAGGCPRERSYDRADHGLQRSSCASGADPSSSHPSTTTPGGHTRLRERHPGRGGLGHRRDEAASAAAGVISSPSSAAPTSGQRRTWAAPGASAPPAWAPTR